MSLGSINNSLTNLGSNLGFPSNSVDPEAADTGFGSGTSVTGSFQDIIKQQLNKLASTQALAKSYTGTAPLTPNGLSMSQKPPLPQPSELDIVCQTIHTLFQNKDVINYLGLTGTQLDSWDKFYAQYAQDTADKKSSIDSSRSLLHQLLQTPVENQAPLVNELENNVQSKAELLKQSNLTMLFTLNKLLTPEQVTKTIDLVQKSLNSEDLTADLISPTSSEPV